MESYFGAQICELVSIFRLLLILNNYDPENTTRTESVKLKNANKRY